MNKFLSSALVAALAASAWAVPPTTFNTHAYSTNDPIDSIAAEAAFLAAVSGGGFSSITEDFEAAKWEPTRSPYSAESVISQNITWHSGAGNRIRTTPDSDSYDVPPPFMIYAYDPASGLHPVPNTLIGESATKLYGIGFWADGTGTKGKIKVILDDTVEVKFERVIGFTQDPPDPPEPETITARLGYEKEFFGVYAPYGFNKFQLLEFAGEFDEVVLMWMRTFRLAYLPPAPTDDIRITDIAPEAGNLQIQFTATPARSNLTLQANSNLFEPLGWTALTNSPVVVSQNLYQVSTPLFAATNQAFRIISTP